MLFDKKDKKSQVPDYNTITVNKEELEKIQDALNALNAELLENNAEKLRFAGFRI